MNNIVKTCCCLEIKKELETLFSKNIADIIVVRQTIIYLHSFCLYIYVLEDIHYSYRKIVQTHTELYKNEM